jgi:hypothetical protein
VPAGSTVGAEYCRFAGRLGCENAFPRTSATFS